MGTRNDSVAGLTSARSAGSVDSNVSGRRLFHIPVIHSQAEMGSLSPTIQAMTVQKLGAKGWERNVSLIDGIWTQIEQAIDRWSLPYEKVRLYQDGLPVCGRELEIVSELAKAGSRNHQLLLRLKERGATLMGTESADLLVQEYNLIKQTLAANDPATAARREARHQESSRSLLKRRDQAIARTDQPDAAAGVKSACCFWECYTPWNGWLARDIQVTHPLYPPSPGGHPCP